MKKILTLLLMVTISISAFAQVGNTDVEKGFKKKIEAEGEGSRKGGILNIGLNQGMLQNWAAGGETMSLAVNGVFNGFLIKENGNKLWENTLDLYYGLNYIASNNFVPRKIDDRIDLSSRYGVQPKSWTNKNILKKTRLMGLARLQTQFSKGFNYSNPNWETANNGEGMSNFLSPLYAILAVGAEYRPNDNFNVFFSPAAARIIVADKVHTSLNPNGAFGIDFGETMAFQFGAYLTARYKTNITQKISYTTRLDLYSNYLKEPENIDVLWDNIFAAQLTKNLGASLGLTFVYDHDIPGQLNSDGVANDLGWVQLKQILNIGFTRKF